MRHVILLAAVLLIAPIAAQQNAHPPQLDATRDVVYKHASGVDLKLWIYEPTGHAPSDSRAAVVFYFGGGWRSGTPQQFEPHCQHLARRGMVCMVADYRVSSRHKTKANIAVHDAKSAVRYIRANAVEMGIDPDRIAAGGGSAGGHLGAAVGFLPDMNDAGDNLEISERPNAMALFNPAVVLAPIPGHFSMDNTRLAGLEERLGAKPRAISPYHHVRAGGPPTIVFHGTADTTVPHNTAALFCAKMQRYGNRCQLESYDGEAHGFFNKGRGDGSAFTDTVKKMDDFFVTLGYLQGPAKSPTD